MEKIEFDLKLASEIAALRTHSRKFIHDENDSEDLVQETLLKALRFWTSFKEGTNFKGWLYTIMRNAFYDICNSKINKKALVVNIDEVAPQVITCSERNLGESSLQLNELNIVLNKLDENLALPFKMHFVGYRYHEIAEKLNLPMGTIKTRIHIARKIMQKSLTPISYRAIA